LGKIEADLKKANAVVYAISNERADALQKMQEAEKLGSTFVFLSDQQAKASENYAGHDPGGTLLKSATFVINKQKKILYAYVGEDYRVRAGADKVLDAVRKASK
jgi:peroxiredoxin